MTMLYTMTPQGCHVLPELKYSFTALQPVIGERTMHLHHDIHHKAYVDGLNRAELEIENARRGSDRSLVHFWEKQLAYFGSGHILHSIYWTILAPGGMGGVPGINTMNYIQQYFGTMDAFRTQFRVAAEKVEGSGWVIAVWNTAFRRLEILEAEKHENLTQWGAIPILVCDLWEHAYYLDYQHKRAEYINAWWSVINWNEVERRLLCAMNGQLPLELG